MRRQAVSDVGTLENCFGSAGLCYQEHRATELFGGQDVAGKDKEKQGKHRFGESVDDAVGGSFGTRSMHRLDSSRSKHVGGFEGKAKERIFGFAFHARPHDSPFFGAVRPAPETQMNVIPGFSRDRVCAAAIVTV